jgi:hypothetical protein
MENLVRVYFVAGAALVDHLNQRMAGYLMLCYLFLQTELPA